jgi:membrane protein YdbS with pleckstrin-like domain
MYCENCGAPVAEGANFCSVCGHRLAPPEIGIVEMPAAPVGAVPAAASVTPASPEPVIGSPEHVAPPLDYASSAAPVIDDDRPVLVLRPRFIGWATLLTVLPIQLFMTFWAGGFCGGFSTVFTRFLFRGGRPPFSLFIFWGAVAFFGIPLVTYFSKKRGYARTEYRFYPNRLEYFEGFLNIEQKTVIYHNIHRVDLHRGVVQRRYGLGTIILGTPSDAMYTRGSRPSGIRLTDIEDAERVYGYVKELIQRESESYRDRQPPRTQLRS